LKIFIAIKIVPIPKMIFDINKNASAFGVCNIFWITPNEYKQAPIIKIPIAYFMLKSKYNFENNLWLITATSFIACLLKN
jgi:hypothetical protein